MSSLIHDLENNEAILLMYLAEELPAEDRAEVEAMLAIDGGMRAELEPLREIMGTFQESLGHLDKLEPIASKKTSALRAVNRAMSQWQVDRLRQTPAVEPSKTNRQPWWLYAASAAAVVAIGLLAWWGIFAETKPSSPAKALANRTRMDRGPFWSPEMVQSVGDGAISKWMMGGLESRSADGIAGGDDALDEVERELVALSRESSNEVTFFGEPPTAADGVVPNE